MARLEDLTQGSVVSGIEPSGPVTVVQVEWVGSVAATVYYRDDAGRTGSSLLYRDAESSLQVEQNGRVWSFDGDGKLLRLVSEAQRIQLAYLFDPLLAVHSSDVEPLPHQLTAVYEEMLTRQPLRFLLADDPGAGKTIMTGLFIKELWLRGDLRRCMIVCPGSLVEQWQDELLSKFDLRFEILTREKVEASASGNWFNEADLVLCRLDQLSRNDDLQEKLKPSDWDLIVCDEAHKLSASYTGNEVSYTGRYRLGQLLGELTRHFVLLSATPHNGKEADFQLFLALLDGDRFEGKAPSSAHTAKADDLMRRLVKEQLVRFDSTPLFPERRAYTVAFELSDLEAALYEEVTRYVRTEFDRADKLADNNRRGTIGFALTILQRRLASSPEAIYQSLKRRRERLTNRLTEAELLKRGADINAQMAVLREEQIEDIDDGQSNDVEADENELTDQATTAQSIPELRHEIAILARLEKQALEVRQSGLDRKWEQLSKTLQEDVAKIETRQSHRKLVIFTEQRDTLRYLEQRIKDLIGRPEAVVTIQGGMARDDRRKAQEAFTQDPKVEILIATDAAGEGINLQRAHLMVNYDLPWNPNRLEQRFGRIHRIGQTEVCHLWNMIAGNTREGEVYQALLGKLEREREALGGRVFDVLGTLTFGADRSLRELLVEAIRYGEREDVRKRLYEEVESSLDAEHIHRVMEERALYQSELNPDRVRDIGEAMARADARRLQPHFISAFFREAFEHLGGIIRERELGRYEIRRVPAPIRERDRQIGRGAPIQERYDRITFDRRLRSVQGKPIASLTAPGHPLLDATTSLIMERYGGLLKQGGVLVDPADDGEAMRALFYLDHKVFDGRKDASGNKRVVSRRMQFVEIDEAGAVQDAGYAPYLDYEPVSSKQRPIIDEALKADWLRGNLETAVMDFAVITIVPSHVEEIRRRKELLVKKTRDAVHQRLTSEIMRLDNRANEIRMQEEAGKKPRLNSERLAQQAENLRTRLTTRMQELDEERAISTQAPIVTGGLLVVPAGLLARLSGERTTEPSLFAKETARVEWIAMETVMMRERAMGNEPRDVSAEHVGYDIESRVLSETGKLRFIEVKGRAKGATTVTVTKNEILTALNKPDDFILAIVEVDGDHGTPRYITRPFETEPDFSASSVNFDISKLFERSVSLT